MSVLLIIIALIFVTGWIPLGIGGIFALRKQRRASGLAMTIIASLWCLISIIATGIGSVAWLAYNNLNYTPPETFNASAYKGKTGKIKLDGWSSNASMVVIAISKNRSKSLRANTKNGTFILPTGKYLISYISLKAGKKNWSASVYHKNSDQNSYLNIEENKTVNYPIGEPFKIEVTSKKKAGGRYTFSLSMKDHAGNKAMIYAGKKNKPAIQILDLKGKVLLEKTLEYG